MRAAWQVILMVHGWPMPSRQKFLQKLLNGVSRGAGFPVPPDELLWNMRPAHICYAALQAVGTVTSANRARP
jgi:hypothetical protein